MGFISDSKASAILSNSAKSIDSTRDFTPSATDLALDPALVDIAALNCVANFSPAAWISAFGSVFVRALSCPFRSFKLITMLSPHADHMPSRPVFLFFLI